MWTAWKSAELEVSKFFGGLRRVRGSYGESIGDIEHPTLSIEVKYGGQIPKYCVVNEVASDGVWVMIPAKFWGKNTVVEFSSVITSDKFIRDGISQALKYAPEKIPLLCVKPKRYKSFVIIMRYSDYLKTSFTTVIPEPPLHLPK